MKDIIESNEALIEELNQAEAEFAAIETAVREIEEENEDILTSDFFGDDKKVEALTRNRTRMEAAPRAIKNREEALEAVRSKIHAAVREQIEILQAKYQEAAAVIMPKAIDQAIETLGAPEGLHQMPNRVQLEWVKSLRIYKEHIAPPARDYIKQFWTAKHTCRTPNFLERINDELRRVSEILETAEKGKEAVQSA
ncbi:MAG: hypothetical protein ACPGSB_03480 [Opitutales bacterium]